MKKTNTIIPFQRNFTERIAYLCQVNGVSMHEELVRKAIQSELTGQEKTYIDSFGTLIAHTNGNFDKPRIALTAHMDEIGFEVQEITSAGTLLLKPLGAWWAPVPFGQHVLVQNAENNVHGVVVTYSPWLLNKEEAKLAGHIDSYEVDIGCESEIEVTEKLGVSVGNPVILYNPNCLINNQRTYLGKALDDRLGCSLIVELLNNFQSEFHPNQLYGIFTTQEEIGRLNSTVCGFQDPIDLCIVIDVYFAEPGRGAVKLGKGPALIESDGVLQANPSLIKYIISIAEQFKIPYQYVKSQNLKDTFAGSLLPSLFVSSDKNVDFNKERCLMHEVPSICIGIPTRYTHSPVGMVNLDDMDSMLNLLKQIIANLGMNTLLEIQESMENHSRHKK